jgi:ankyrin repeat protein
MTTDQIATELDMPDETGVSLIHYLAVLDYYEVICVLLQTGANVNLKVSGTNLTALIIAAARGNEKTV